METEEFTVAHLIVLESQKEQVGKIAAFDHLIRGTAFSAKNHVFLQNLWYKVKYYQEEVRIKFARPLGMV